MADSPTDPQYFESFDGARIAWRELGEGRPAVLIHGYFSTAEVNWLKYGHAAKLAARGFRVIMPDLRAHGDSDRPHDPAAYVPDILTGDGHALIAHLGLTDYDLGGYSLGARTTVRMLANGAAPRRVVLSGMGLAGIVEMFIFMALLLAGFGYVIKKGILRWNEAPSAQTFTAAPALQKRPVEAAQTA